MVQRLSWSLLHRLRYFLLVWPVQEDAEKHKVMGGFYSEYQGHSLDTRDGFWGPCGPPEMECRIGSGCMLLGREWKASSRMSVIPQKFKNYLSRILVRVYGSLGWDGGWRYQFTASQHSRVLQMSFSSYKYKQCMGLRLIMGQGDQEMTVEMEESITCYMGEQVASPFPSLQTPLIFPSLLGNFT